MSIAKLTYPFDLNKTQHSLDLVFVQGTHGRPYNFGDPASPRQVNVNDFFISTTPITHAFWIHVMGTSPAINRGDHKPLENISWLDITAPDGFLFRLNTSPIFAHLTSQLPNANIMRFRLPSETEWEYAARGGPHWTDGFRYSGSNDIDSVAFYASGAITPTMSPRNPPTSSASSTCPATSGNGARIPTPPTSKKFPPTARHIQAMATSASSAAAASTTGPSTAPSSSATKSPKTFTTAVSGCAWS
jgi:hypothetical protein